MKGKEWGGKNQKKIVRKRNAMSCRNPKHTETIYESQWECFRWIQRQRGHKLENV